MNSQIPSGSIGSGAWLDASSAALLSKAGPQQPAQQTLLPSIWRGKAPG